MLRPLANFIGVAKRPQGTGPITPFMSTILTFSISLHSKPINEGK